MLLYIRVLRTRGVTWCVAGVIKVVHGMHRAFVCTSEWFSPASCAAHPTEQCTHRCSGVQTACFHAVTLHGQPGFCMPKIYASQLERAHASLAWIIVTVNSFKPMRLSQTHAVAMQSSACAAYIFI
jgi:hypothetical protein